MAEFTFACPRCGGYLTIDSSAVAMAIACPHCASEIVVPKVQNPTLGIMSVTIPCAGLALSLCLFTLLPVAGGGPPVAILFVLGCIAALLALLAAPVLAVTSLLRRESPSGWAYVGLTLFIVPLVIIVTWFLGARLSE